MDFTVENLYGLLIRSRLQSPESARGLHARWLTESKDAANNPSRFLRWLVAQGAITEYQAALLSKGYAENHYLGQYKILERLGKGRMAGVYKAVHQLGQVVAIKVLPPSRAKEPNMLARFQREARMALRLKHPHVVRAFQLGESNGLHHLVMEYLEGETLDEVLQRRKRLPPAEGVRLVHQALLGLQHIHEQGLVHRDLKPANLMLVPAPPKGQPDTTQQSNLKILDIGLGRALLEESEPKRSDDAELTGEGVIMGTPDYMAPEQANNAKSVDIRADIYSLGCVLYQVLTGQVPFPDTVMVRQLMRHAKEDARPLAEFNPAIPEGLQQIVNWMMAKKPEERYPTPARAAQALEVFLAAEAAPATTEDKPELNQFLTWLEGSDNGGGTGVEAGPAIPVAVPTAALTAPVVQKGKKPRPATVPVTAPPVVPVPAILPAVAEPLIPEILTDGALEEIDVELETIPEFPAGRPLFTLRGRTVSRRDALFFGLGAAGSALVSLILWLISRTPVEE